MEVSELIEQWEKSKRFSSDVPVAIRLETAGDALAERCRELEKWKEVHTAERTHSQALSREYHDKWQAAEEQLRLANIDAFNETARANDAEQLMEEVRASDSEVILKMDAERRAAERALAVAVEWIELKGRSAPMAGPWAQRALAAIEEARNVTAG